MALVNYLFQRFLLNWSLVDKTQSPWAHTRDARNQANGTNESEQIRTKPNELGKTGQKMGIFRGKMGKNGAKNGRTKSGKKRAKKRAN